MLNYQKKTIVDMLAFFLFSLNEKAKQISNIDLGFWEHKENKKKFLTFSYCIEETCKKTLILLLVT